MDLFSDTMTHFQKKVLAWVKSKEIGRKGHTMINRITKFGPSGGLRVGTGSGLVQVWSKV